MRNNTGYSNSGDYNSGYRSSGYYNSGNYNSGNYNSGYRNSGHCNLGDYNSGNYNSGHSNSGMFNTNEPNIRLFNKETNLKKEDINIPYINLKVTEWIDKSKMTDEQKENDKNFKVKGGTLIKRSYKEAWKIYWKECSDIDKQKFKDLPNFDSCIFEEITGIDISETKTIVIDGKTIEISKESFEQLKKSLT